MRRIAFLSPLPPDTSGIADYSAELLPALARHYEIDLFTEHAGETDSSLAQNFALRPLDDFRAADRRRPYSSVVYQIGNGAAHHGGLYRTLLQRPGIVVLHEYMLHHLMRDLALEKGGKAAFVEDMRYCYGETGRAMAGRLLHANNLPEMWTYPLFERVVDAAQGLIVHSRATRDRVLASRPDTRIAIVPHHLSLHDAAAGGEKVRDRLRSQVGVDPDAFVVASFGHLNAAKRLDVSLRAFSRFRRSHPQAVYLLVGEISHADSELRALLDGELGQGVVTTGRVALDTLLQHMAHCDVAVNLRHPTGGETSGACLRLLGLGRAVVVTDAGWFSEIPDECCAKIRPGDDEEASLCAVLEALADREPLRRAMQANAARWAGNHHRLDDCARGYAAFIETITSSEPEAYVAVPPLAPAPPGDVTPALIAEISGALGDLGFQERDTQMHRAVAVALVSLDL